MLHQFCRTNMCVSRWLAGCMGFLWVTGFSFFHCVASPFHSFVTIYMCVSEMKARRTCQQLLCGSLHMCTRDRLFTGCPLLCDLRSLLGLTLGCTMHKAHTHEQLGFGQSQQCHVHDQRGCRTAAGRFIKQSLTNRVLDPRADPFKMNPEAHRVWAAVLCNGAHHLQHQQHACNVAVGPPACHTLNRKITICTCQHYDVRPSFLQSHGSRAVLSNYKDCCIVYCHKCTATAAFMRRGMPRGMPRLLPR